MPPKRIIRIVWCKPNMRGSIESFRALLRRITHILMGHVSLLAEDEINHVNPDKNLVYEETCDLNDEDKDKD